MIKKQDDTQYIENLVAEGEHCFQDFKFEISDTKKIARSISAFANTKGGRLLIGVKDNGKIAGIRSEEEIYMIEAAAQMYCHPKVETENYIYTIKGKTVLEVRIKEANLKPVYAIDENNKLRAYVRIKDENILASPVHLRVWQDIEKKEGTLVSFTEKEHHLLNILKERGYLTLNQCYKLCKTNRHITCKLLANFIRFGLVKPVFIKHKFHFKLDEEL